MSLDYLVKTIFWLIPGNTHPSFTTLTALSYVAIDTINKFNT